MKKQLFYCCLLAVMILAGCSDGEEDSTVLAAETSSEIPSHYRGYVKNPQVTSDALLQKKGQSIRDNKGELVLKAAQMESRTGKVGPMEITIREVKNLHYQPAYSLVDFYHSYTQDTEFNLVKFFVEIKNTSNQPLHFAPIAFLETSAGEKKLWEDDIYLEGLNGEVAPHEIKRGNAGFILQEADFDSVTITTSDVFAESDEKVAEAEQVDLQLQ